MKYLMDLLRVVKNEEELIQMAKNIDHDTE
jgi:hypothetical protein